MTVDQLRSGRHPGLRRAQIRWDPPPEMRMHRPMDPHREEERALARLARHTHDDLRVREAAVVGPSSNAMSATSAARPSAASRAWLATFATDAPSVLRFVCGVAKPRRTLIPHRRTQPTSRSLHPSRRRARPRQGRQGLTELAGQRRRLVRDTRRRPASARQQTSHLTWRAHRTYPAIAGAPFHAAVNVTVSVLAVTTISSRLGSSAARRRPLPSRAPALRL